MIRLEELEQAIAECQAERNPNANTCVKLAAYYALKRELYGGEILDNKGYSYDAPKPEPNSYIDFEGDTDFSRAVYGKNIYNILPIIEDLAETVKVLLPRVYAGFMRDLQKS